MYKRIIDIPFNSYNTSVNNSNINYKELVINQNSKYGYAGEVWDGSLVFIYYLIKNKNKYKDIFKGKKIIELGAGTGVCSLLIAALFDIECIYITDLDKNVELIDENIKINKHLFYNKSIVSAGVDWTNVKSYENLNIKFDYIICCEIIYNELLFKDIVNTIDYFYKKFYSNIIFSYTFRKEKEQDFFVMIKEHLNLKSSFIDKNEYDNQYCSDDINIIIMNN